MITRVPYDQSHGGLFRVQEAQRHEAHLLECPPDGAMTWLRDDGHPLIIGGLVSPWPGRALAWSFVSELARPHLHALCRDIRQYMSASGFERIECMVRESFDAGHRWARMLGFRREAVLRNFRPRAPHWQRDESLYARVV